MNDKALLLCAVSMLGLLVWRYWLARQGAIRAWASIAVWGLVLAAGAAAAGSRYIMGRAADSLADVSPAEQATVLADALSLAMNASAIALSCIATCSVLLVIVTFVQRRREARGPQAS